MPDCCDPSYPSARVKRPVSRLIESRRRPAHRPLVWVLALLALVPALTLSSCASTGSISHSFQTAWRLDIPSGASVVGTTPTTVVVDETREVGEQFVGLSLKDGRTKWVQVGVPEASASLVGSTLLTTQTLGSSSSSTVVVSAFDSDSGHQVWQTSFPTAPIASFPDRRFLLLTAHGAARLAGLAGWVNTDQYKTPPGCAVTSAAEVPGGPQLLIAASCASSGTAEIDLVDQRLHVKSRHRVDLPYVSFGAPFQRGNFTIFTGGESNASFIFNKAKQVFQGQDFGDATYSTVGTDLEITPASGNPVLLNSDGLRITGGSLVGLLSIKATDFEASAEVITPSNGDGAGYSQLETGAFVSTGLSSDGASIIEVRSDGKNSTVQRREAVSRRLEHSPSHRPEITLRSTGAISVEHVPDPRQVPDEVLYRYFGRTVTDPTGTLEVLRLRSTAEAHSVVQAGQKIADDPGYASAAIGRCAVKVAPVVQNSAGTSEAKELLATLASPDVLRGCIA